MLTSKERLHKSFRHEAVDRVPCICPGGMMNMVTKELMERIAVFLPQGHQDAGQMAQLAKAVYEEGCFENYGVPFCMTVEAEAMGADIDFGSDIYEPRVTKYVIDSVDGWRTLRALDVTQGRAKIVLEAIALLKAEGDAVPIIGNLTGPISTASSVMEPVQLYKELRKKPEEAHALLQFVTEQLCLFAEAQIAAGADVIAISDPSGTGEILGPKDFDAFVVRYINELVARIHAKNAATIVHICGHMDAVYEEVNRISCDALSFDSLVSMKEARENLKDRVLMGNVSSYALESSHPEKIKQLTKVCIRHGSDILSPACGLSMRSPLANVTAIKQAIEEDAEDA